MICLLVVSVFITYVIPIWGYLTDRIRSNEIGEGFVGLLTIIPKFLGIINVFYSVYFVSSIENLRHPGILPTALKLSELTIFDYLIWLIVFVSMIILIEAIRFIEYKVCFEIKEETIYPDKSGINDEENYFFYDKKRIDIKCIDGNNIISLKLKPTLHGQDSINGKDVEYIIKEIEERLDGNYKLSIFPKNPVKYSFTEI